MKNYHFIPSGSTKLEKSKTLPKICVNEPKLPENMIFVVQRITSGNQFIKTNLTYEDLLPAVFISEEKGFFHFDTNNKGKRFTCTIGFKKSFLP